MSTGRCASRPASLAKLQKAIDGVTGSGVLTREIGGTATTDEVTAAIIEALAV